MSFLTREWFALDGPTLVKTANDIAGILIYFALATGFLTLL